VITSYTVEADHFDSTCQSLSHRFVDEGRSVKTKTWQALDVSERPEMTPIELLAVTFDIEMPQTIDHIQEVVRPNLPWAEDHFLERVSGAPWNPPPSHEWWPFAQKNNAEHQQDEKFSHTYPERFWPKHIKCVGVEDDSHVPMMGIRFEYGDLYDVLDLLVKDPYTRQAYLPVFFPEDTGAHHGQRIPCTLGYQFMYREGELHIIYGIRSCDFMRHFRDDVYMAMRLALWMQEAAAIRPCKLGRLVMNIGSFHIFEGDLGLLKVKNKR
jgi:hypothetical protein